MALTESYMLPLGSQAPDFKLPDVVTNKDRSLQELKGEKGSLVIFICNHCPYVVHL
ncbi:redoxin domain-containing protein, partial [Flavobacteriaceae bacterium]|nr:redoxin domain-containing protein [Flavobacteriaceae bacterium]